MENIWDIATKASSNTLQLLESVSKPIKEEFIIDHSKYDFKWNNYVFASNKIRRAHVEIVDARESRKIWVMHFCIFPYYDDPMPIFGFDVVAGQNKITGLFHDFSIVDTKHRLIDYFKAQSDSLQLSKPRQLPDWCTPIFSPSMIAAGNVGVEEFKNILTVYYQNLLTYLTSIGLERKVNYNFTEAHDKYCYYQKQNDKTPAMMHSLGVDKQLFSDFMDIVLFPESNMENIEINDSLIITKKFRSSNEFSLYIEEVVYTNKIGYMEAIIKYCNDIDIDVESISKLVNQSLKEKIQIEAEENNYLRRRAKLPL
ncbi:MAG: hypothetical protein EBU90_07480 [Proteobacteria bacterium]|nr:hypothetical protein [Pseudomonadota bacterium]NBP13455.1 hypothetical protein [bacterium]